MQKDLADRIGRHANTLNRWESGDETTTPSLDDMVAIARELQVSVSDLVGDKPSAPVPSVRSGPLFFVDPAVRRTLADDSSPIDAIEAAVRRCVRIDPDDHEVPGDEFRALMLRVADRLRRRRMMTPAREALLRQATEGL